MAVNLRQMWPKSCPKRPSSTVVDWHFFATLVRCISNDASKMDWHLGAPKVLRQLETSQQCGRTAESINNKLMADESDFSVNLLIIEKKERKMKLL